MAYTYILECRDGSFYTGSTKNLKERIKKHNDGKGARYTRGRTPVNLVYQKYYDSFRDALKEERRIKSLTRNQKFDLIKKDSHH